MNDKYYLTKLHAEILTVMDEIDRVCRKNSIKYYLIGGSLLGAIRHAGFIPWDDDLDIVMPRDDMNRFVEVCHTDLDKDFKLEWYGSKKGYYQYFPKVSKAGTLFEQEGIKKDFQSGIFVDIFPLDLSPEYSRDLESVKSKLMHTAYFLYRGHKFNFSKKCVLEKFVGSVIPRGFFINRMERQLESLKQDGTSHYANFGSQYSLKKQTMPVEWYGDGVYLPFEDRVYMAPSEYLKVVRSIFGANYMQLPPVEKRRCHYPSKIVFSDKTVIEFKTPNHTVTFKDQFS